MKKRKLEKKIVHFLHIGKTGGTVIRDALEKYASKGNYRLEFHNHGFHFDNVKKGERAVFFLRDPISRFVSGFYSRQRMGRPRYNVPWRPEEEKAFGRFHTANELAEAISNKDSETKRAAKEAMNNITHVRNSFWNWFRNKRYFLNKKDAILFVGTQENLNDDFEKLKDILGLPKKIKLSKDEIRAHKNPAHVNKQLSQKAKRNLKKWYNKDYEFIQLCKKEKLL
jgi:hypothetical protein